ncbi:hypothetical protein DY000_02060669 [Brassica cretica]|uniref:Uncharacterized protein n=1 Tax=Brassica cretica TaxID=69181 RepID=A0ABQ7AVY8_BRACR|nr:hypothetical protein DY000_02060669 [Brassica cretica]
MKGDYLHRFYFSLPNSDKIASSFFCPLPTTTAKRPEEIYTVHGVDRAVVVDLASTTESLEAVHDGYGGAYLTFFETCGLFFPIPEHILSILAELGLSLTQISPNFLRHLLALLVKARGKGLLFGLDEFSHLVLRKRNNQNPGTFLMSPRQGRHIIHGIPYHDQNWQEEFFVFKIDEAFLGSFDFSRLPRYWAEDIFHSGRSDMTDGLGGLIGALRGGRSNWSLFDRARIRAAFSMSDGSGVTPEVAGAAEDEAEHSQEEVGASSSNPPPPPDRLERWLARRSSFHTPKSTLAGKSASGLPPISIPDSEDEGHMRAMEANNEFAATLERRLQDVTRSDELYEIKKVVRELKLSLKMAHDREHANAAQLAAAEKLGNQAASLEARLRVVSNERKSALEQEKWEKKKAAADWEARLKEVMANIDLQKEIMNNNLLASDELLRLRAKEVELGSELDVMAVSDFSVGKLDLPQISEDLPEEFFAKVPSEVNEPGDETKIVGTQFEDGEFDAEE